MESFTLENMPPASLSSTMLALVTAAMVPITATMPTAAMTLATATLLAIWLTITSPGRGGVE